VTLIGGTGTLSVSSDSNLGAGTIINLAQNTVLMATSSFATAKNIVLAASGSNQDIIVSGTSNILTINGVISSAGAGGGAYRIGGNGTVLLTANNTTSANLTVLSNVKITGNGTFGNGSNNVALNSATADLGGTSQSVGAMTFIGTSSSLSNGTVTAASYGAANTSGTALVSANLTGVSAALTKATGAGTLTLNGTNTYGGGTTISAGKLILGNDAALGTGALTVNGGTTFDVTSARLTTNNNAQNWNGDFTFTGTNTWDTGTGAVTMNASRTVTVSASTMTVGGAIAGSGFGLTLNGAGTLALNGANTYTGTTTIGGTGILQANKADVPATSGALGNSGNITFTGGLLQYTANSSSSDYSARFKNSTSAIYLDNNGQTVTLAGLIDSSNTGGLTKSAGTGFGSLILSNTGNTFTGQLAIWRGTLQVNSLLDSGAGSNGQGSILLGFGSQTGTLKYAGSGATLTRAITMNGSTGSGKLDQSGAGLLKFTSDLAFTTSSANAKSLTLEGSSSGTGEFAGVIGNNPGGGLTSLIKDGTGTWTVSNNNTFTGATAINSGILQIGNGGATGSLNTASAITNNATLAFNRSNVVTQGLDFASGISGTGKVVQNGSSNLILANGNTYSGNTTVNGGGTGSITIGDDSALGAAPVPDTAAHLVLNDGGLVTTGTVILSSTRGILLSGTGGEINVAGVSTTYGGIIAGTGLRKSGTGILLLTGANSYTGATQVTAGTLVINGDQSTATGAVTIDLGATLSGNGTVGGATTISGTHNPGNSPGLQTFVSNLTYDSTAVFKFELTGNTNAPLDKGTYYDAVNVGGDLTITSGAKMDLVLNGPGSTTNYADTFWTTNRSWSIFGVSGSITGGSLFTLNSISLDSLNQAYNAYGSFEVAPGTNNLNWVAVPEPAAWILAAFGLTTAVVFRRRRRD